jgi:hypothetical protein
MRLAISGTAAQGKTTLLDSFLKHWDMYDTPEESYRVKLPAKDKHSSKTTKETQWDILNHMIDEMQKYDKDDFVIFDRCPLDNLVYTLWSYHKNTSDIDELFVEKCIPVIRESFRLLDIIFLVPITNVVKDDIEDDGVRDVDAEYISEIDNFFKALYTNWYNDDPRFFPKEDRTAIVEIFGSTEDRIKMLELYIDKSGTMFGEEDTLVDTSSVLDQFGMPTIDQTTKDGPVQYK